MSIASVILDPLLRLNGPAAYGLVGGLAFSEAAIFVGFVVPGETAVILGGVLAYRHSVSLSLMIAVVVVGAIAGDSVGYEVGRAYGDRLLTLGIFRRRSQAIETARRHLRERGGSMVFIGRFTAFLRAVMPGLAGTARMPYRKFLAWNAAGGIVWGTGFTLLGYLAGASYTRIEKYAGWASEAVLAVVIVVAIALFVRRFFSERDRADGGPEPAPAEPGPAD